MGLQFYDSINSVKQKMALLSIADRCQDVSQETLRRWVCPLLSEQSTVASRRLIIIRAERAFWHDGMACYVMLRYGQFF